MGLASGNITLSGASQEIVPVGPDSAGVVVGIISTQTGSGWFKFGEPAVVGEGIFVEAGAQLVLDNPKSKVTRLFLNGIAGTGTPIVSFHRL